MFDNKILLITGGTGIVGNIVTKQLINTDIKKIKIFSRDEHKQLEMGKLYKSNKIEYIIGDIRDYNSIIHTLHDVDFVLHTAAMKNIYMCESNPVEAVKTNVIGTDNVVNACIEKGVKKLVCMSTDKAVYPSSTYGYTKAISENNLVRKSKNSTTDIVIIRPVNILYGVHNVFGIFLRQIEQGKPLTITDRRMGRYFLNSKDLYKFIMFAFENGSSGDIILVRDVKPCLIETLAYGMKQVLNSDVDINTIEYNNRIEKINEALITKGEAFRYIDIGKYRIIKDYIVDENKSVEHLFPEEQMDISEVVDMLLCEDEIKTRISRGVK